MTRFFPNKAKSIESLDYFFFLQSIYILILNNINRKEAYKNKRIAAFLNFLKKAENRAYQKAAEYVELLENYTYWISKDIYLKNINSLINEEMEAIDFCDLIFQQLQSDFLQYRILEKDVEKQSTIDLELKMSGFSSIMKELRGAIVGFTGYTTVDPPFLNEDEFRSRIKELLRKLQKYL